MWIIWLRRKVAYILEFLSGLKTPYMADLTVTGTEAVKIADITGFEMVLQAYANREAETFSGNNTIICYANQDAIPETGEITHIIISGSETADGTYGVNSITNEQVGVLPPFTWKTTVVIEGLFLSGSTAGVIQFMSSGYSPTTAAATGLLNGTAVQILNSLSNNGMYLFGSETEYHGANVVSLDRLVNNDTTQPGELWTVPVADDLIISHNLNTKFIRRAVSRRNETVAEHVIVFDAIIEGNANETSVSASSYGLEIGDHLRVCIEYLGAASDIVAPGGLPDEPEGGER